MDALGHCSCNPGVTGAACEYSDEKTCTGHGAVQNDGTCICVADIHGSFFGERCEEKRTNPYLQALVVVLVLVTTGFAIFLSVLIRKEKRGNPLFAPLMEAMSEDATRDKDAFSMGGMGMTVSSADTPGQLQLQEMGHLNSDIVDSTEPAVPPPPM